MMLHPAAQSMQNICIGNKAMYDPAHLWYISIFISRHEAYGTLFYNLNYSYILLSKIVMHRAQSFEHLYHLGYNLSRGCTVENTQMKSSNSRKLGDLVGISFLKMHLKFHVKSLNRTIFFLKRIGE